MSINEGVSANYANYAGQPVNPGKKNLEAGKK
jgi:hypothetical protein